MKNKTVLWVIIVLLVITTSCAGYGFYLHMVEVNTPPPENPNKDFKYDGKLYFYDENKELIGKYTCNNPNNCGYARTTVDDTNYKINYYKDASSVELKLIDKRYAFISDDAEVDGDTIVLYDVVNQRVVRRLTGVKDYNIGINNDYLIVRDENKKWGVMKMSSNAGLVIEFKYNFLGLLNRIDEKTKKLKSDSFVANDVNGWKVISDSDADITKYSVYPIFDYSNNYTITANGGYYFLNDANSDLVLSDGNKAMQFVDKYLKILDYQNDCYLINLDTLTDASSRYRVNSIDDLVVEKTLNGLELYIDGELKETILNDSM